MTEEYDALAAKTTGEEDENSSGLKRFAWAGGLDGLADLLDESLAC